MILILRLVAILCLGLTAISAFAVEVTWSELGWLAVGLMAFVASFCVPDRP